eukprot:1555618-Rhodomonas_salina.1
MVSDLVVSPAQSHIVGRFLLSRLYLNRDRDHHDDSHQAVPGGGAVTLSPGLERYRDSLAGMHIVTFVRVGPVLVLPGTGPGTQPLSVFPSHCCSHCHAVTVFNGWLPLRQISLPGY